MDNLDDSENNAKISDSAYSNSCSNSQSRRSHSSKSTHSGSSASGSSGYGGKPSNSGSSSNKLEQTSKKDKEAKKKKQSQTELEVVMEPAVVESRDPEPVPVDLPKVELNDVSEATTMLALPEKAVENMEIPPNDMPNHNKNEIVIATMQATTTMNIEASCQVANVDSAGFSCVISMHDGVVMYTTHNLTTNLGFPKEMWIGRSFIDFVHPKDRNTFASQITNVLAIPKLVNGISEKVQPSGITDCTMVCRIRRHRNLGIGFGVKDQSVIFMPFLLKFSFKDINEDDGKFVYLIIQATPIYSSYKTPNESKVDAVPFVIRHSAAGNIEYIDIESVQYLGYLPQDIHNTDALLLYHPDDLPYLTKIYESIVKEGNVSKSMPFRMLSQNGDYVTLETEWSSFINPWSMKLEFVIGKHRVIEGPTTPDVFLSPKSANPAKATTDDKSKTQIAEEERANILRILKDVLTKPAEKVKNQMTKRCHDLALIMENLLEEPKPDELRVEIQDPDLNCCERDSVMLGEISPHHDYNDSKSSTGTPLSYNQLNYNDNLQRFFDSHENFFDETNTTLAVCEGLLKPASGTFVFAALPENNDQSSSGSSNAAMYNSLSPPANARDNRAIRLTESLLTKHNHNMEKELVKCHRGTRTSVKGERTWNNRQKKKEHLARCNATYQPTMAGTAFEVPQMNGIKRPALDADEDVSNKQHCSETRMMARNQSSNEADNALNQSTSANQITNPSWQDPAHPNAMNTFTPGMPQLSNMMMQQMPGMYPVYYAPNGSPVCVNNVLIPGPQPVITQQPENGQSQGPQSHIPMLQYACPPMSWMYPQPMYGGPYMYSQMPYNNMPQQQQQTMINLPNSNYVQACKSSILETSTSSGAPEEAGKTPSVRASRKILEKLRAREKTISLDRDSKTWPKEKQDDSKRQSTEKVTEPPAVETVEPVKPASQSGQISDETMDRTDGESSYSTFYSSFFKTESGSAEDSSDPKKARIEPSNKNTGSFASTYTYDKPGPKKAPLRKSVPPWMENVCITPELIYKYQIPSKPKEEVLKADLEKIKKLEQPAMVNEQLEQLYLDLQLEGVAARLTLEEGITTSSSSSSDESPSRNKIKIYRRKREYNKMSMIYEVDAPLPPGDIEITPGAVEVTAGNIEVSPSDIQVTPSEEPSTSKSPPQ